MPKDWLALDAEVKRIIAESKEPFSQETIAQTEDFLELMRYRCPVPEVAKGYWSTFCIFWGKQLQFEVFEDRIEMYRFYEGRTDIRHVYHVPGEPFPLDLVAELPSL